MELANAIAFAVWEAGANTLAEHSHAYRGNALALAPGRILVVKVAAGGARLNSLRVC